MDTMHLPDPELKTVPPLSARCTRRNERRGAAVVEFAVVAPVFFMMIIGFIEFGRALMVQQVLVNASRVGAREAITVGATTSSVKATVENYANSITVPSVAVTMSPAPETAASGDLIKVTVSVWFNDIAWLRIPWFMGGKQLSASSTMRKEGLN